MLFFAGDADLMCNWIGIENTIQNMTWKGSLGFGNVTEEEWHVNGTQAGTWRTARNMTFVKVFDAGHMVRDTSQRHRHSPYAFPAGTDRSTVCSA
jgi:carboxypeptidase D